MVCVGGGGGSLFGAESLRPELQSMTDFQSLDDSISIKSCFTFVDDVEPRIALSVEDLAPACLPALKS